MASARAKLTTGLEVGKGILETAGRVGGDAALVIRTGGGGRAVVGIGGGVDARGGDKSNASLSSFSLSSGAISKRGFLSWRWRRGRRPRGAKAPGPFSSENEGAAERIRRWFMDVVYFGGSGVGISAGGVVIEVEGE